MPKKPPQRQEYRFKIEAYTPDTIPMAKLAEYMTELAAILGEEKSVHFVRVEAGSTALVHRVEHEAVPRVKARALSVIRGDGPEEARRSYRKVNRMLRDDNASAVLRKGVRGAKILEFPGAKEAKEEIPGVSQPGSLSGVIIRVGGTQEQIPIIIESEGQPVTGCHTNRQMAKALARHLFEPVRVNGQGYWMRDDEGVWRLNHFRIEHFEPLENLPLTVALGKLRSAVGDLPDTFYEDMKAIRSGGGNGSD